MEKSSKGYAFNSFYVSLGGVFICRDEWVGLFSSSLLLRMDVYSCDEAFLGQLFAFGPRAVVYVSCDPATQMRDLRHFLTAGYTLRTAQPFDLFPQTRHLECVLTLTRNAAAAEAR